MNITAWPTSPRVRMTAPRSSLSASSTVTVNSLTTVFGLIAFGGAVENRTHGVGLDALNVLGVVGQRIADDGVGDRIAREQGELDPVGFFVGDDLAFSPNVQM